MKSNALKAGLIGFGTVGEGFYHLMERLDYPYLEIKSIVVTHREKPRSLPASHFSYDVDTVLEDPEIDLIVEAITDADESFRILKKALQNGKNVITASKKMVASYLPEIIQLQRETGKHVRYEAAVCGSVPILQNLNSYFHYDKISGLKGVFNGTANFILTEMEKDKSFAEALNLAQERGLAEADPSSDIDGHDTRYKLSILTTHIFGVLLKPEAIFCYGVWNVQNVDREFAEARNWKIRLQASATEKGEACVLPSFVSEKDFAFSLEGEYNFVEILSESAGTQRFEGKGAGAYPTGLAVLSDVEQIRNEQFYHYAEAFQLHGSTNVLVKVYLRSTRKNIQTFFEKVFSSHRKNETYIILGEIRLEKLKQISPKDIGFLARLPEGVTQPEPVEEVTFSNN